MEVQASGKRQNKFVDHSFRHIYNLFYQLLNDTVDSLEDWKWNPDQIFEVYNVNGYMFKITWKWNL